LLEAITSDLGGFEQFTKDFTQNAMTQFGSGWSWLYVDHASGKLKLGKTPNQDSPLMEGNTPLLGVDVWEHAYYLKYQNRRPDYLKAWWNVVNWDAVAKNYGAGFGRLCCGGGRCPPLDLYAFSDQRSPR